MNIIRVSYFIIIICSNVTISIFSFIAFNKRRRPRRRRRRSMANNNRSLYGRVVG